MISNKFNFKFITIYLDMNTVNEWYLVIVVFGLSVGEHFGVESFQICAWFDSCKIVAIQSIKDIQNLADDKPWKS